MMIGMVVIIRETGVEERVPLPVKEEKQLGRMGTCKPGEVQRYKSRVVMCSGA